MQDGLTPLLSAVHHGQLAVSSRLLACGLGHGAVWQCQIECQCCDGAMHDDVRCEMCPQRLLASNADVPIMTIVMWLHRCNDCVTLSMQNVEALIHGGADFSATDPVRCSQLIHAVMQCRCSCCCDHDAIMMPLAAVGQRRD